MIEVDVLCKTNIATSKIILPKEFLTVYSGGINIVNQIVYVWIVLDCLFRSEVEGKFINKMIRL